MANVEFMVTRKSDLWPHTKLINVSMEFTCGRFLLILCRDIMEFMSLGLECLLVIIFRKCISNLHPYHRKLPKREFMAKKNVLFSFFLPWHLVFLSNFPSHSELAHAYTFFLSLSHSAWHEGVGLSLLGRIQKYLNEGYLLLGSKSKCHLKVQIVVNVEWTLEFNTIAPLSISLIRYLTLRLIWMLTVHVICVKTSGFDIASMLLQDLAWWCIFKFLIEFCNIASLHVNCSLIILRRQVRSLVHARLSVTQIAHVILLFLSYHFVQVLHFIIISLTVILIDVSQTDYTLVNVVLMSLVLTSVPDGEASWMWNC